MKKEPKLNVKVDTQYVAFLLLEALYQDGKIDANTFSKIQKKKQEYLILKKEG